MASHPLPLKTDFTLATYENSAGIFVYVPCIFPRLRQCGQASGVDGGYGMRICFSIPVGACSARPLWVHRLYKISYIWRENPRNNMNITLMCGRAECPRQVCLRPYRHRDAPAPHNHHQPPNYRSHFQKQGKNHRLLQAHHLTAAHCIICFSDNHQSPSPSSCLRPLRK